MNSTTKELTLWQLTNEHQKLLNELYDYETGEVNEIVQAKLNASFPTIEKKCIGVAQWIKKLESDKKELENLSFEIERRQAAYDIAIEKFKRDILTGMQNTGISKITCPYFTLKIRKNPYSTEIVDEGAIPDKFMKKREIVRVEVKPDKSAIKDEVIKTGVQVPGAIVVKKDKLEIEVDRI